jgi:hypothetical protein
MATATLDIVAVLNRELPQYGCPASTLASLAGVSSGKISSYLKEITRCPVEHELRLRTSWTQLKRLIELCRPLPLDLSKAGDLRRSIEAMVDGSLHIVVFNSATEAATETEAAQ